MDDAHPDKIIREALSLQLKLPVTRPARAEHLGVSCREALQGLLSGDLDFHGESSAYASHNLHAFPAKFPPQLPRKFIEGLTEPGDVVLDPMAGSGTTVVEALLAGRRGLGFDIDPLALRLCKAKTTPLPVEDTISAGQRVAQMATRRLEDSAALRQELTQRFGAAEQEFVDYWFAPATQLELMALLGPIEDVAHPGIRSFLEMTFSSIIITKSGGVSLARDLAHTRPHRVETKAPRSALEEYRKRLVRNLRSLASLPAGPETAQICRGDAQALALSDESVDLIVTSPPYASNAIDYMRAHKFSLVWLRHTLDSLARLRSEYIGHDAALGFRPERLPDYAAQTVTSLARIDPRKSVVLQRYYSEMSRSLREMARVLRPGRAAIVVVGTSNMRGMDTKTDVCLGEIGKQAGLELVGIAARQLDRDRRMMPARRGQSLRASQIEARMHEEYVIGFVKPERSAGICRLLVDGKRLRDVSDLPFDLAV